MIYKGFNFRNNKNLVVLPNNDEDGNFMPYVEEDKLSYVYFGKIIPKENKKPINAIKTHYKWADNHEAIYATPVDLKGHSTTNMAYGIGSEVYLAKDGHCYQAKMNKI